MGIRFHTCLLALTTDCLPKGLGTVIQRLSTSVAGYCLVTPGGGGGVSLGLGQVSATHPPTHPPTQLYPPPPGGGGLCPPPAVTYKHLKICGTTELTSKILPPLGVGTLDLEMGLKHHNQLN